MRYITPLLSSVMRNRDGNRGHRIVQDVEADTDGAHRVDHYQLEVPQVHCEQVSHHQHRKHHDPVDSSLFDRPDSQGKNQREPDYTINPKRDSQELGVTALEDSDT